VLCPEPQRTGAHDLGLAQLKDAQGRPRNLTLLQLGDLALDGAAKPAGGDPIQLRGLMKPLRQGNRFSRLERLIGRQWQKIVPFTQPRPHPPGQKTRANARATGTGLSVAPSID